MTDQKLANDIYDAANALNEKLAAAEEAGLNVLIEEDGRRLVVEAYRFINHRQDATRKMMEYIMVPDIQDK